MPSRKHAAGQLPIPSGIPDSRSGGSRWIAAVLCTLGAGWPDATVPARTTGHAPDDVAVVIGVEQYDGLPWVDHARRDAEAVSQWMRFTRGVPSSRVHRLVDPTHMRLTLELADAFEEVGPEGTLWIWFSGQAIGSPTDGRHYLLGKDESLDDPTLSVELLQSMAEESAAGRVVIVVDASFVGLGRTGAPLDGNTRYVLPPPEVPLDGRVVTWLGAGAREIAGPLEPARQGLFTWHALGALTGWADGTFGPRDGQVTLEEAQTWVQRRLEALGRDQHPSVDPRPSARAWVIGPAWREMPELLEGLDPGPGPIVDPSLLPEEEADKVEERLWAEEEIRRQVQEQADREWSLAYGVARSGSPEGMDALRRFVGKYAARTYLWGGAEIVVSARQIPEARRLLRSGGRSVAPLVDGVDLPAGTVALGSAAGTPGRSVDETLHRARLTRAVHFGRTEVDQGTWTTVMGYQTSEARDDTLPVVAVTWLEAVLFCNALSRLEGYDPAYEVKGQRVTWNPEANGWRLPTEAEWVLAAGDRTFPGFNEPALACAHGNVRDKSHPDGPGYDASVGRFDCDDGHAGPGPVRAEPALPNGIRGLSGNVSEWTWDAWAPFEGTSVTDPAPDKPAHTRVIKGGSYDAGPRQARTAGRSGVPVKERRADLGFRVVRTNF